MDPKDEKKKKPIRLEWLGGIKEDIPDGVRKIEIAQSKKQAKKVEQQKKLSSNHEEVAVQMKNLKVKWRKEVKGRSGHPVLVLFNFEPETPNTEQLTKLCGSLKTALGCGGTVENRTIILQTLQEDRLKSALEKVLSKLDEK